MFTRGGIEEDCAIPLEGNVHKRGDRGGLCQKKGWGGGGGGESTTTI